MDRITDVWTDKQKPCVLQDFVLFGAAAQKRPDIQLPKKAGYTATPVAYGWEGALIEASGAFGQEQYGKRTHKG